MQGPVDEIPFQEHFLDRIGPDLPVVVVAGFFAERTGERDFPAPIVLDFFLGQPPEPVRDVEQRIDHILFGEAATGRHDFVVGTAQQRAQVGVGGFVFKVFALPLLFDDLGQHAPFPLLTPFAVEAVAVDLIGFRVEEGEVGEDIVDVAAPPGHFDVHLLGVDAVGVAPALGGDDGLEVAVFVALPRDEADVAALLDTLGQALENVVQAVQLHALGVGDGAVDFRAEDHQVIHQRLATHAPRLVAAAQQQVSHGNV